ICARRTVPLWPILSLSPTGSVPLFWLILYALAGTAQTPSVSSARERTRGPLRALISESGQVLSSASALSGRPALTSPIVRRDIPAIAPPDRNERRFSSAEWQRIPSFDYLRQSYLINSRFLSDWIEALEAEPRAKRRLRFIARQFSDAMSPANFAATNPEALKLALETGGESLAQGIRLLLEDVHRGRISTTDESMFEVGKNLAVTEGAVIFE